MSSGAAQPEHVLMTADAVGGVWSYAVDLAAGLSRSGVRTTLLTLGPWPAADQRAEAAEVKDLTLIDSGLPLDWTAASARDVEAAGEAVARWAGRLDVDLVHLNSPALAAAAGFDRPVVGACHSCLATWWAAVRGGDMPEDFRWRTELLARGLAAGDVLVAPSRAFARATADAYGLPLPRVAWNGRSVRLAPEAARERVAFTAGRLWDAGKKLEVLDAAAAMLDAPVLAAGPTEGPNGERVQLGRLGLLGRLCAEGVRERLARAEVFVSAAAYEPFGLAVLEAAQAGCALTLSDIPSFRELWDGAAVFAPVDDPHALAEAMRSLLDDRPLARRMGEAARARSARYSLEAMTSAVLDAYGEALAGRKARRVREAAA